MSSSSSASSGARKKLRVILIGAGRMGKLRAPLLYVNPRVDLAFIVDPVAAAGQHLAETYNAQYAASLIDAIKQSNAKCDAVWISTPTFTHKAAITEAAQNGLAIFTEKPVAETSGETQELFAVARQCAVPLCCGFQRRFDRSYIALREAVKSGRIGTPLMVRVFFADHPCPPIEFLKTGGDPFMDLSPHDVDFVRWVLDDEPVEVFGSGCSSDPALAEANVIDNATMYIKFKKGAMCTLMMSRGATYGYDQRCEVFGDKGIVHIENIPESSCIVADRSGYHHDRILYSFPQRFRDAFQAEVDAFVKTYLDNTEWPIKEIDCVNVQAIANAGFKSYTQGKMVAFSPPMVPNSAAVRVKPIGNGNFGSYIVNDVIRSDKSFGALCTLLPAFTRSSGKTLVEDVAENKDVDAVYVCSPDAEHQPHAVECLLRGKHVLVEKPVTPDFKKVLAAAQTGAGVLGGVVKNPRSPVLVVGFHRRFAGEFLRAQQHLAQLRSPPQSVVIESRDPVPADNRMAFVLANSCCHDLDMLVWLFPGTKVTFTQGKGFAKKEQSQISLFGQITHPDGAMTAVEIRYSKEHPTYLQRLIVDSVIFGYDHQVRDGITCCEVYADAYKAQWKWFLSQITSRSESCVEEKARLDQYRYTHELIQDTAKCLNL